MHCSNLKIGNNTYKPNAYFDSKNTRKEINTLDSKERRKRAKSDWRGRSRVHHDLRGRYVLF